MTNITPEQLDEWKASLGEDDIPAFEDVTASEILGDNMAATHD